MADRIYTFPGNKAIYEDAFECSLVERESIRIAREVHRLEGWDKLETPLYAGGEWSADRTRFSVLIRPRPTHWKDLRDGPSSPEIVRDWEEEKAGIDS